MTALPQTDKDAPPVRGWKIPGAVMEGVALDPGIVYTSADVLLFAGTSPVGFGATMTATGIAAGLRTLSILKPSFLQKHPKLAKIVFDDRTPLRAGGLALLVVGGAALATGAFLPAAASILFAVANFRLAESISKKAHNQAQVDPPPRLTKPNAAEITAVMLKRPEIYLNAGFACAGLMAGGGALFILPVVATAFGVGMHNALREKPEYAGHPKIITASAAAVFSAIGYANGHTLIAAAHAINAVSLVEMERRVTPGGMKQIIKDMAGSVKKLITPKAKQIPLPKPVHAPAPVEVAGPVGEMKPLSYTFRAFAVPQPANENAPVATPAATPLAQAPLKKQL